MEAGEKVEIKDLSLNENQKKVIEVLDHDLLVKVGRRPVERQVFSQAIFEDETWLGGAIGTTNFQTFHLSLLAVIKEYRRHGLGEKLMDQAEQFARQQECHLMTINTQNFQARAFYEKCGFEVFAELKDAPFKGTTRYYLKKSLEDLS